MARRGFLGCTTFLIACAAVASACSGGGGGDDGPAPAPTSSTPPALTAWATPPATEDPTLDLIVALAVAGDETSLRPLMRIYQDGCSEESSPGSGPLCEEGQEEGTEVDAFSVGVCDGNSARPQDVVLLPDLPLSLYAIVQRPGDDGPRTFVIFRPHSGGPDFMFQVDGGEIAGFYAPCGGTTAYIAESTILVGPPGG